MNQTRRIAARHISPCNAFTSLMSGTAAATNRANVLQYSGMRGIVVCLDGPPWHVSRRWTCVCRIAGALLFSAVLGADRFPAGFMGYDASGS